MEKTAIHISEVLQITDSGVQVVLASTGRPLWLPLKYAERFNDRIFIPVWLHNEIFSKDPENAPLQEM